MSDQKALSTKEVRSRLEAYIATASERLSNTQADLGEIDRIAKGFIETLTPKEIGFLLHEDPKPIPLSEVSSHIRPKYRAKYGNKNLKRRQFFKLRSGSITFITHEHNLKFKVTT